MDTQNRRTSKRNKEDIALANAIDDGRISGYVSEEKVMQTLKRIEKHKIKAERK